MLEYMNGCNRNFPDGPRSGPGTPSYRYNQIKQIRQNIESSSPPPSGPLPAPPGSAIDAIQSRIGIELTDEYVNLLGEGIANDCVITQEEISNNPEAVALTDAFKEVTAQRLDGVEPSDIIIQDIAVSNKPCINSTGNAGTCQNGICIQFYILLL